MASDRYLDINNLADGRAATGGRRDEELFHVTVTGGEKELLDPILAERNSEYSEQERANLLDRKDNGRDPPVRREAWAENLDGVLKAAPACGRRRVTTSGVKPKKPWPVELGHQRTADPYGPSVPPETTRRRSCGPVHRAGSCTDLVGRGGLYGRKPRAAAFRCRFSGCSPSRPAGPFCCPRWR